MIQAKMTNVFVNELAFHALGFPDVLECFLLADTAGPIRICVDE